MTLVRITHGGTVTQAKTEGEKRAMLGVADDADLLLAAWPGEWSQDVFVVDDLAAARVAVGLPRRRTVWRKVAALPYIDAAKLWQDNHVGNDQSPELAAAVLDVVLSKEPPATPSEADARSDRYDRYPLIRTLAAQLPDQRLALLRDPQHGALVQRALLAGTELIDEELLACLPEITKPAGPLEGGVIPPLLNYVQRFPRLIQLAEIHLQQAAAHLVADGWSPMHAARSGQWEALIVAARLAKTPDLIDALAQAAVFGRSPVPGNASGESRWRDTHRYTLVDLLVGNAATSDNQIRHLLDRLTVEHIKELQESARTRSRLSRICAHAIQQRRPTQSGPSRTSQPPRDLPTDEELSHHSDPTVILSDLIRDRSQHRTVVVEHALKSAYMTDEVAWQLPVQDLERHPTYGPRLAARVAEICGDSPNRWRELTRSWSQPNSLLARTLLKRLEDADANQ